MVERQGDGGGRPGGGSGGRPGWGGAGPRRGGRPARGLATWPIEQGFATCPPGLEDVLAAELSGLGAGELQPVHGGVPFPANWDRLARANLELRSALRVLVPLAWGPAENADELYELVGRVPWERHVDPASTLAVQAKAEGTPALSHSVYVAQLVKDAIVDRVRQRTGRRPSVDLDNPDLMLVLHLQRGYATLSLDSSGRSLHRRGYREVQVRSPLNEALAAGIVLASGWRGAADGPLLDPLCGSATLPIEAALIATRTAPGLLRPNFAFLRWPGVPRERWAMLLEAAAARVIHPPTLRIAGSDHHSGALSIARQAIAAAGMERFIELTQAELAAHRPATAPRVVITNPPYGERLGDEAELPGLYRELGSFLRDHCRGATAWILSGNAELTRHLGLKSTSKKVLYNGGIECRLLRYEMRAERAGVVQPPSATDERGGIAEPPDPPDTAHRLPD